MNVQGKSNPRSSIHTGKGGGDIEDIQDETIIRRVQSGERDAFRLLTDKYAGYVYQLAYSVLRHPKDAEDAAQEAFVSAYLSLQDYRSQGFKAWLARIAVNRAIDKKRQLQRRREMLTDLPDAAVWNESVPSAETHSLSRLRKEQLNERIGKLPLNYREVIHAFYMEDKSYLQIAEEQGLELKNVETRLYRAKKWIRQRWSREDWE